MRPKSGNINSVSITSLYNIEQLNVTSLLPSSLDITSSSRISKPKSSINSIFPEEQVKFLLGVPILNTETVEENKSPLWTLSPESPASIVVVSQKSANRKEETLSAVQESSFINDSSVNYHNNFNSLRLEPSPTPTNASFNQSHLIKTNITVFSCLIISICGILYVNHNDLKLVFAWILFIACKVVMHMMPPLYILRNEYVNLRLLRTRNFLIRLNKISKKFIFYKILIYIFVQNLIDRYWCQKKKHIFHSNYLDIS